MFEDMKEKISDWTNEEEVRQYLSDLLNKKAFDKKGLIYGMGHAVYSISDPRAEIFKGLVQNLAKEKQRMPEFELYSMVERLAPEVIAKERKFIKVLVQMWTFTVDSYIVCWIYRLNCIRQFLQLQELQVGVHIVLKKLLMKERLFVQLISLYQNTNLMFHWMIDRRLIYGGYGVVCI